MTINNKQGGSERDRLDRRQFIHAATGVAAMAGLSGCADDGNSDGNNSGDVLKILSAYSSDSAKDAFGTVNDEIDSDYPDTDISMNYTGFDGLYEQLVSAGTTGDWPDLVLFVNIYSSMALRNEDLTRDPTAVMEGVMEETGGIMDDVPETQYLDENGDIYHMPMGNQADVSWYRTDLLEEVGEEMPQTWDDELRVVQKLHEADNDLYGVGMSTANHEYPDILIHGRFTGAGGYFTDPEGNVTVDSQYLRDTLEHMGELSEYAPPGSDSWGYGEVYTNFAAGNVASAYYYGRTIANVRDISPELENDFNCVENPIPDTSSANPSNRAMGLVDGGVMPKGADNVDMSEDWFSRFLKGGPFVNSALAGVPGNTLPMFSAHNEAFQNFDVWSELENGEDMRDTLYDATRNAHPRTRQSPDHPIQPGVAEATNNDVYATSASEYWAGNISVDEAASQIQREAEQALDN